MPDYARHMKKKMTVPEFEEWSRQAVEWRTQAEDGKLEYSEYERLLKKKCAGDQAHMNLIPSFIFD